MFINSIMLKIEMYNEKTLFKVCLVITKKGLNRIK